MRLFAEFLLLGIFLTVTFYILYVQGYMITGTKSAVKFIGSNGKDCFHAVLVSCKGNMKKVARFKESREYEFELCSALTDGAVVVELLDAQKQPVMHLDAENTNATVGIDKKKRYYLVYTFETSSGEFEFRWK